MRETVKTRDIEDLHLYQREAIGFILQHPRTMLWLDMGLGKTTCTLHALRHLIDTLQVFGVLVLAPKRVCQTVWRQEAKTWRYTRPLTFSYIHGAERERSIALRRPAMIYLSHYENLPWLERELGTYWIGRGKKPPFDTVVLDEISRLKSTRVLQGSVRGHAFVKLAPFLRRRIGLTGTPAPNGLQDLFGQYLCLDDGERFGRAFSHFQKAFFYSQDYQRRRWKPFERSEAAMRDLISDITISMSSEEYLQLPPLRVNDIWVDLPAKARKVYDKMEKEFFLEFDSGATLEISNTASLYARCLQVANGACYKSPESDVWESIHDAKLDVLEEIMEEAAGEPILLAYQFRHDAEKICKRFKKAVWISSKVGEAEMVDIQTEWDRGEIPLLIGHPASIGHGLNLQHGAKVLVWYGLTWSQDLYAQTVARLRRQGQKSRVTAHRIFAENTLDVVQKTNIEEKFATEDGLRRAVRSYRALK